MLGELQGLALVVGGTDRAIECIGLGRHLLEGEPADDLAVLQHEGHLMAAHFKHAAAAGRAIGADPEAGIEEAAESVRQKVFPEPTISKNSRRSWPGLRSRGFLRVQ